METITMLLNFLIALNVSMLLDDRARLDAIIAGLLSDDRRLPALSTVRWLCKTVQPVLLAEPSLLSLDPPIRICGDIHGQYLDLLRVFESGGLPPISRYLFLGDYVDRGQRSVEVIILLYALKVRFPESIFLLRGNHESPEMTELFGFADECKVKLEPQLLVSFLKTFDCLPIGAMVGERFFCVHGGLSPALHAPSDLLQIVRPTAIPSDGLMSDLLWSDPNPGIAEWGPNPRGASVCWGLNVARAFMDQNGLSGVVRAHQMASEGYSFPFDPEDRRVITVFTASKYAGQCDNKAAYLQIGAEGTHEFTILPKWIPHIPVPGEECQKARPPSPRRFSSRKHPSGTRPGVKRSA
jgi:serine/threonine-protein phosphatase PP1 catalytic subunit